jgi:hypothetical protein
VSWCVGCYPPGMLHRLLALAAVLLLAGSARADDAVECDRTRDACDTQILELCPAGADVLDEQEVPGASPQVRRYRITFRCRGAGGVAPAPVAPAPAPAPGDPGVAPAPAPPVTTAAPSPETAAAQDELSRVNFRLAELEAQKRQHGIVGPIVLLGVGAASTVLFMALALEAKASADELDDGGLAFVDDDFDGDPDDVADEEDYRASARLSGALAAVSAGVAAGGGIWLLLRLKKRNANKAEIRDLKLRQEQLRTQAGVSYSFAVDPFTRSAAFKLRF